MSRLEEMSEKELAHELYMVGMLADEALHAAMNFDPDEPEDKETWEEYESRDRYHERISQEITRRGLRVKVVNNFYTLVPISEGVIQS